jgi:tRNA(adenine34) deaminase
MTTDNFFMSRALELAQLAQSLGEVPVGAVVVINNIIVGEGYNRRELRRSCIEHAEIMALNYACEKKGRWRLSDATLYSTLEPCIMCAGALLLARIKHVVFGAHDPKFGALESLFSLSNDKRLNHRFSYKAGVESEKSAQMLREFFIKRRQKI